MRDAVLRAIRRHDLCPPGSRIGVAVSGGADSVCLLYVLHELTAELGIRLFVLHLDHGLRPESAEDAQFVVDLAASLGLPCEVRAVDVRALDRNLEQAGRKARRKFFAELVERGVADRIALGHTQSDQAETVIGRLLRGSGTKGLSAMQPLSGFLIRPLLGCSRSAVIDYLTSRSLAWREDATNQDPAFLRNRIRRSLLPQLETAYNPQIVPALARTAELLASDEEYLDREASAVQWEESGGALQIRAADLESLHPAIARRAIRAALLRLRGDLRRLDFGHIDRVLELARSSKGAGRAVIPGVICRRSFDWLRLNAGPEPQQATYQIEIHPPARLTAGGHELSFEVAQPSYFSGDSADKGYNEGVSLVDWTAIHKGLCLRSWKSGDRLQPAGEHNPVKLKDLFQSRRIPVWRRAGWPVLVSGESVVWASRFGVAQEFAAGSRSEVVLRIREVHGLNQTGARRRQRIETHSNS